LQVGTGGEGAAVGRIGVPDHQPLVGDIGADADVAADGSEEVLAAQEVEEETAVETAGTEAASDEEPAQLDVPEEGAEGENVA